MYERGRRNNSYTADETLGGSAVQSFKDHYFNSQKTIGMDVSWQLVLPDDVSEQQRKESELGYRKL